MTRGWRSSLVLGYSLATTVLHRHWHWVTIRHGVVQRSRLDVRSAQAQNRFSLFLLHVKNRPYYSKFYLRIISPGLLESWKYIESPAAYYTYTSTLMFTSLSGAHVPPQKPQWLRHFIHPLTVVFRDELKWWSGVELGRRFLFLLFFIPFPAK